MQTSLIIVTYDSRHTYVLRLTEWSLKQNTIHKIIIVDNNSAPAASNYLIKLRDRNKNKIILIKNEKNCGPGSAIKNALEKVIKEKISDFCWILDDDNIPEDSALVKLHQYWRKSAIENKEENLMLVSYRLDRPQYLKAVKYNRPEFITGHVNVFRTFHIGHFLNTVFKKSSAHADCSVNPTSGREIPVAPFGGMFFNIKLVGKIGYPDPDLCIYFDDYEYSGRIIESGGRIILVEDSVVMDQEKSWYNTGQGFVKLALNRNRPILYYTVRNRILFEKKSLVNNRTVYYINAIIYCSVILIIMLINFRLTNILVFITAVFDGLSGRKGIRYELK